MGRTRLLERRDPKGLPNDLRDCVHAFNARIPLGDGLEHADDVDDLVGLLVEFVRAGLSGDCDHRRPIEEGIRDPRQQVRRTRAQRCHGNARPAGQSPVDVRHEGCALLVAGRDMANRVGPRERVEDVHRLLARDGEDVLAALGLKALDEEMGGSPGRLVMHRRSVVAVGSGPSW